MLELRGVGKTYSGPRGTVRALERVSLDVNGGEFCAVCGRSGSGKTTLLMIAGGLLAPDAGAVDLDGVSVYETETNERAALRAASVGFVFQQFHLLPYLSAVENVLVPSLAMPIPDAPARARDLLERFGVAGRARHLPAELSTGERQRVALARSLLARPGVVLADEPTGNLDDESADAVITCLAESAAEGAAVLLVTHDKGLAARASRTLTLREGRLSER